MGYQQLEEAYRLCQEGSRSLNMDDNNITQENGDALLLEVTDTFQSSVQFKRRNWKKKK